MSVSSFTTAIGFYLDAQQYGVLLFLHWLISTCAAAAACWHEAHSSPHGSKSNDKLMQWCLWPLQQ